MHGRILTVYFLFLLVFGGLAPPMLHAAPPMFGRLFPTLPPYAAPTDAALDDLTCGAGTGRCPYPGVAARPVWSAVRSVPRRRR